MKYYKFTFEFRYCDKVLGSFKVLTGGSLLHIRFTTARVKSIVEFSHLASIKCFNFKKYSEPEKLLFECYLPKGNACFALVIYYNFPVRDRV